jgi:hypothetical protein
MFRRASALLALLGVALLLSVLTSCTDPPATATSSFAPSLSSFASSHFVGSGKCATCHGDLVDEKGNDVSIDTHWRSTMMANAAKDPFFQAKVSSEVERSLTIRDAAEDKCATCHMPMARTQAHADGKATALLNGGFLDSGHRLHHAALDGVSCTACHQIQAVGLGLEESFGGYYVISTTLPAPNRLAFGPFPDPLEPQMQGQVGFLPVEGPHMGNAGLCATCHNVYTPYVDAEGQVAGEFPEQVTYLEWKQSTFGDSAGSGIACQQCHMPAAQGGVVISTDPKEPAIGPRSPFSQHQFAGGNAFMLRIYKTFGQELGLTASETHLDATLARTLDRLENGTAQLAIVESEIRDDKLTVVLEVTNWAGHKFPTGYPARRAWIYLDVTDSSSQTVFESGRPGEDGSIAGSAADRDPAAYEPHYDTITDADQVQIYESVMENTEGAVTYTLLHAATYSKDNRLLPDGYDKANVLDDSRTHGSAAGDESFVGGSDRITYQIDLRGQPGPYTVSARLLYQSISYRFAMDLFADEGSLVERFAGYYDGADHEPVVIADEQISVP